MDTDSALAAAVGAHRALTRAEAVAAAARVGRDRAVLAAAAAGVSGYRIAAALGVAESTVGRVLARAPGGRAARPPRPGVPGA